MKQITLIVSACAVFCALLVFAVTRCAWTVSPGLTLQGKLLGVDTSQQTITVELYAQAPNPDAPGKVPDEIAQRIAEMSARVNELGRHKGRRQLLQQLNNWIAKAQCWREIEYTIIADDHVPVVGVKRLPLAMATQNARVRCSAFVEGVLPDGQLPGIVILNSNLRQVGVHTAERLTRLPPPTRRTVRTFFELVGEVTNTSPLTVQVNGQSVVVNQNPKAAHLFVQQRPVTFVDLHPGDDIFVRAQMASWSQVTKINRLFLVYDGSKLPIPGEDVD